MYVRYTESDMATGNVYIYTYILSENWAYIVNDRSRYRMMWMIDIT